jgi:hypothetical protein
MNALTARLDLNDLGVPRGGTVAVTGAAVQLAKVETDQSEACSGGSRGVMSGEDGSGHDFDLMEADLSSRKA